MRRLIFIAALALFLCPVTAFASHYDLADVQIFPDAVQEKLVSDGIETTENLLDALLKSADRKAFAAKYGVDPKVVDVAAHKLEFMQIVGVGPKAAELLYLAGVKNVKALGAADPNALLDALLATNREHAITGVQPDMTVIKDWIAKAKKATRHLS